MRYLKPFEFRHQSNGNEIFNRNRQDWTLWSRIFCKYWGSRWCVEDCANCHYQISYVITAARSITFRFLVNFQRLLIDPFGVSLFFISLKKNKHILKQSEHWKGNWNQAITIRSVMLLPLEWHWPSGFTMPERFWLDLFLFQPLGCKSICLMCSCLGNRSVRNCVYIRIMFAIQHIARFFRFRLYPSLEGLMTVGSIVFLFSWISFTFF